MAEEMLENAVHCALKYQEVSDSTGAITGNLLGAYCGFEISQKHWIEQKHKAPGI